MNNVYRALDITKQGFHQWMDHHMQAMQEEQELLPIIRQIRSDHPRMSAKEMYRLINPVTMGRDKFEQLCFENGFKIERYRSYQKTTNSLGVTRFENLILKKELTDINQVWVSDITYYSINDRFYYLTFIMDLFSRYVAGYSASINLLTESTTIPALKMAINKRQPAAGLVFHSDGGGQYYCKRFLAITREYGFLNSMGETVYENPHAERINGTLKNDYIKPYNPLDFESLKRATEKAIRMYNQQRPHKALKSLSPKNFEMQLQNALYQ